MNDKMKQLLEKAKEMYGENITLCGKATAWKECFTVENGMLMFWFNIGVDTKVIMG